MTVLFCLVRAAAVRAPVGCLLVVDHDVTAYRITDQDLVAGRDAEWHRVVVEAGHDADRLAAGGVDVPAHLVGELCRILGIDAAPAADGEHPDVRVLRTMRAQRSAAVWIFAARLASDGAVLAASSFNIIALPTTIESGLLSSCATPASREPNAAIFSL